MIIFRLVFNCEDDLDHKLLLVTEVIFRNNQKADGKALLAFRRVNQVMLTSRLAYKITSQKIMFKKIF